MKWNTGVLAGGIVLLALALGGIHGLFVVIALTVSCWLVRSISIAGTSHHEMRSEERDARRPETDRKVQQERQAQQRRRQAEQECEAEQLREPQSEWTARQSQDNRWWSILEVPPHASADEIKRAYHRKIKECHPDLVVGLAPELLEVAETYTRTLNAAYSEANRVHRSVSTIQ
jgi:hypothetical protein